VGRDIIGTDGSVPGTVRRSVDRWPGFTFANFDTEQREFMTSDVTAFREKVLGKQEG
jgi:hypothetical protein